MAFLPPRPLSIRLGFAFRRIAVGMLWILLGVGGSAWLVIVQVGHAIDFAHDLEVWQRGLVAREAHVQGKESSNRGFNSYTLTVSFRDKRGRAHEGVVEFATLLHSVDSNEPVVVRYDPKDPNIFALSWAVEATVSRTAAFSIAILFGLFLAVVTTLVGLASFRRLGDARRVAEQSDELALPVVKVVRMVKGWRETGERRYHYSMKLADGRTQTFVFTQERGKAPPLFTDASERFLVALVSPRTPRPVVVERDFSPFRAAQALPAGPQGQAFRAPPGPPVIR